MRKNPSLCVIGEREQGILVPNMCNPATSGGACHKDSYMPHYAGLGAVRGDGNTQGVAHPAEEGRRGKDLHEPLFNSVCRPQTCMLASGEASDLPISLSGGPRPPVNPALPEPQRQRLCPASRMSCQLLCPALMTQCFRTASTTQCPLRRPVSVTQWPLSHPASTRPSSLSCLLNGEKSLLSCSPCHPAQRTESAASVSHGAQTQDLGEDALDLRWPSGVVTFEGGLCQG